MPDSNIEFVETSSQQIPIASNSVLMYFDKKGNPFIVSSEEPYEGYSSLTYWKYWIPPNNIFDLPLPSEKDKNTTDHIFITQDDKENIVVFQFPLELWEGAFSRNDQFKWQGPLSKSGCLKKVKWDGQNWSTIESILLKPMNMGDNIKPAKDTKIKLEEIISLDEDKFMVIGTSREEYCYLGDILTGRHYRLWDTCLKHFYTIWANENWTLPQRITDKGRLIVSHDIVYVRDNKGFIHCIWHNSGIGISYDFFDNIKWHGNELIEEGKFRHLMFSIRADKQNNLHVIWRDENYDAKDANYLYYCQRHEETWGIIEQLQSLSLARHNLAVTMEGYPFIWNTEYNQINCMIRLTDSWITKKILLPFNTTERYPDLNLALEIDNFNNIHIVWSNDGNTHYKKFKMSIKE